MSFVFNNITYNILTGSTVAVGSNPTVSGAITIPNQVTNNSVSYTVVSIAANAFQNNTTLTSVTFPSSLTTIGNNVFTSCSALISIDLSVCTNLTTIGTNFLKWSGVSSVKLSSSITNISGYAFYACSSLTSVDFSQCTNLTSIGSYAFYNCDSLISVDLSPCTKLTTMNTNAFDNATYLTSVKFPSSMTTIGSDMFWICTNLTTVDFSVCTNLTSIRNRIFKDSGIRYVSFPSSLTDFSNNVFENCLQLQQLTFTGILLPNFGTSCFLNINTGVIAYMSLDAFNNPNNTASKLVMTGNNPPITLVPTFVNNGITYNILTGSTVSVGNNQGITSTSLVIPNQVTNNSVSYTVVSIADNAFQNNTTLTSVTFPSSLTDFSNNVFENCLQLQQLTFTGILLPNFGTSCFLNINTGVIAYMSLDAFKNPANSTSKSAMTNNSPPIILKVLQSQMVCFKEDSKILTIDGYKPIQDLRKGDLIKTANNDFKPIELIGKQSRYHPASTDERIKDQLYRCSQTHFPEVFDDLIITGCHSILVDELTEDQIIESTKVNGKVYITEGKYRLPACVDERTQVYEHPGMYTIYHLALENEEPTMNYGIYANGLLVESCSIRFMKDLSMLTLLE